MAAVDSLLLPTSQRAIVTQDDGSLAIKDNVSLPQLLQPDMIIIKTVAVALNPTDFKMPARFPSAGTIDGCDFAGRIVQLGPGVTRPLKIGDRVFGAVHGANPLCPQSGAFAEYIATYADFVMLIPEDMAWETAAAIGGAGIGAVGLALFCSMQLSARPHQPSEKQFYVLVSGGASASGTMAIQILRRCGLVPIATCSPQNSELVKSYGAEQVFDYHAPTCADEIRAYTKNSLKYALDCITTLSTMLLCYKAIGRLGGFYTALELPPQIPGLRKSVKQDWVMAQTLFGKEVALSEGYHHAPNEAHFKFGKEWAKIVQDMMNQGELKSHPVRVLEGGFDGIMAGLGILREGKISAQKLVCFIGDT